MHGRHFINCFGGTSSYLPLLSGRLTFGGWKHGPVERLLRPRLMSRSFARTFAYVQPGRTLESRAALLELNFMSLPAQHSFSAPPVGTHGSTERNGFCRLCTCAPSECPRDGKYIYMTPKVKAGRRLYTSTLFLGTLSQRSYAKRLLAALPLSFSFFLPLFVSFFMSSLCVYFIPKAKTQS